ncbi:MAG: metallophosphoesterase [Bacteroidaceae bacterium]|nr:metallophosphoesterase [Bacteroidaceae bacterium]
MNRREFLGGVAAISLQGALSHVHASPLTGMMAPKGKKKEKVKKGKLDENLVAFISDMHINPAEYEAEKLMRVVNDILSMNPRPKNVIGLGDLANLYGHVEDYECAKQVLQPLEDAGITVTLGMGNHDRRENFARIFPEKAAATRLPGRYVYVVETPRADFIVLDSLQQGEDTTKWITPGALNDEQVAWLEETLKGYRKPVFISAHHPLNETKVTGLIRNAPSCCGYIHGHDHCWRPGWINFDWRSQDVLRTLCLPSTGFWGDIGYSLFRLEEDRAVMQLRLFEYFFHNPLKEGEEKPLHWTLIEEDLRNQQCSFAYKRAIPV